LPQPSLVHGIKELVNSDETATIRIEFLGQLIEIEQHAAVWRP
jgi:hypothetical protein